MVINIVALSRINYIKYSQYVFKIVIREQARKLEYSLENKIGPGVREAGYLLGSRLVGGDSYLMQSSDWEHGCAFAP